jgi:hypothetical protein
MTRLFPVVLITVVCLAGLPSLAQDELDDENQSAADRIRASMEEVEAKYRERAALIQRAGEFGVRIRSNLAGRMAGVTGTFVFADEFRLDPERNAVNATGNVKVQVWDGGLILSQIQADQVTIGQPGQ